MMARTIVAIPELWTDGVVDAGVARDISFHMKVQFDTGEVEWHYYGTAVPEPPPAGVVVTHPVIHFPADFLNIANGEKVLLYDLALLVARNLLQL